VTSIDFYVGADDRIAVACRLAAKAVQAGRRMLVFSPDGNTLARLDQQLWTQPPTGFVPHCFVESPMAGETPVLLARALTAAPIDDILLNLGDDTPGAFARFGRLIEVVSGDESDKALARARFRHYKDRGYEIRTHNLAAR